MRNGFKFKNRHSSEFHVTVRTKSRPVIPSVKTFTADLPYRDGEYDFSASNPQQREHYMCRIFTISLTATADSLDELQNEISRIGVWLRGSGDLIFDDIPCVVWSGRISDEIVYMPEHGGKTSVIEVSFRAAPFGRNLFGTEGPVLDTPMYLDSQIPLSLSDYYTFKVERQGVCNVINFGDMPARPLITITGGNGRMTLSLGEKTLSFTSSGKVSVDFEKQTVTDTGGAVKVSGEYFEFAEGANELSVASTSSDELTVTAELTPEYMYNAVYSEDFWGEENA